MDAKCQVPEGSKRGVENRELLAWETKSLMQARMLWHSCSLVSRWITAHSILSHSASLAVPACRSNQP